MTGPKSSVDLDGVDAGPKPSGPMPAAVSASVGAGQARLVTRSGGLRVLEVHRPEDLQQIATSCLAKRAVGLSTIHDQSSRSHALLRIEVAKALQCSCLQWHPSAEMTPRPRPGGQSAYLWLPEVASRCHELLTDILKKLVQR